MASGKRLWKFLFYPGEPSCPENWYQVIEDWGVPVLVSPEHNLDVDSHGNIKKMHRHGIAMFDGPKPDSEILKLCALLGVPYAIEVRGNDTYDEVRSRRREERYLCHLDSKEKVHYDPADLIAINGYEIKYLEDEYEIDAISAIHDIVEDLGIVNYADLANELVTAHRDLMPALLRHVGHFNNFCYARYKLADSDNKSYIKSRTKVGRR